MVKFFCIPSSLFTCKAGIVDSLDFSQLRLEEVPKEILKSRKFIEELLLNVNGIESLPPEFFRCNKLKRLDLSENKLKVLPPEIGCLQMLLDINLSKNEFVELPEEIGECRALQSLNISTNIVPGLPKTITNLSALTNLNVSNNSLTQLPQDIELLVSLQYLDAGQCELRFLPPTIVQLNQLRVLDLCENYLTELPAGLDGLESLEILDLHNNMIATLADDILKCQALRTLDFSSNSLSQLPESMGDLRQLVELNVSDNSIAHLPHSIGQLRKLEVLKASKNRLTDLTPAICSCEALTDLVLCENMLNELPSSLGNLRHLKFLDVNVNNLRHLPTTIGGCQQLGVLALRCNQLKELPMEIGRLEKLQVLDLVDNHITYLPFTLTVLYKGKSLSALWLAYNQPSLPKLSVMHEPVMNVKVLTCYLLPQKDQQPISTSPVTNRSCVGGASVRFQTTVPHIDSSVGNREEEDEEGKSIGRFERYDTPHPKPYAPKNRMAAMRNSGDFTAAVERANLWEDTMGESNGKIGGMLANGGGGQKGEAASARNGACSPSSTRLAPINLEARPLRSVLKRSPNRPQSMISLGGDVVAAEQVGEEVEGIHASSAENKANTDKATTSLSPQPIHHENRAVNSIPSQATPGDAKKSLIKLWIRRGRDGTFGWHMVGGADSVKYKDQSGLFIARLVDGGAAQLSGVRCDDRIVSVNGQVFTSLTTHDEAVEALRNSGNGDKPAEIVMERNEAISPSGRRGEERDGVKASPNRTPILSPLSNISEGGTRVESHSPPAHAAPRPPIGGAENKEIVSVTLSCGKDGKPGFSVAGSGLAPSDPVRISALSKGGPAESCGKLHVNDRLLSINGENVKMARHDQVVAMLTGKGANAELYLVVERGGSATAPDRVASLLHSRSLPSLLNNAASEIEGWQDGELPFPRGGDADSLTPPPLPPRFSSVRIPNNASQSGHKKHRHAPLIQSMSNLLADDLEPTWGRPSARQPHQVGSHYVGANSRSAFTAVMPTSKAPPPPPTSSQIPTSLLSTRPAGLNAAQLKRMFSEEKPLATSSPIPSSSPVTSPSTSAATKSSQIPVMFHSPGSQSPPRQPSQATALLGSGKVTSTVIDHSRPAPPAVAPKPKLIPEKLAFTSKVKKFEEKISAQTQGLGVGGATNAKRSGIPMKKPLISSQDLEKLRNEELNRRVPLLHPENPNGSTMDNDQRIASNGAEREDKFLDLSDDPCFNLLMRSGPNPVPSPSSLIPSPSGPHVIRTRKAELRAERSFGKADSPILDSGDSTLGHNDAANCSRASSSLSNSLEQRAVELEKRQQWRQARLPSMDVESKRADEVIRLISSIPSSPIPIQQ